MSRREKRWPAAEEVLLVLTFCYLIVLPGGAAHPRFRAPAMPLLAVFAGAGADRLFRMLVLKGKPPS